MKNYLQVMDGKVKPRNIKAHILRNCLKFQDLIFQVPSYINTS